MPKQYDITRINKQGRDLAQEIENTMRAQSKGIIGGLPSEIKMTRRQYDDLMKFNNMQLMYDPSVWTKGDEQRLYKTNYNVMECKVVDASVDAEEEIMGVLNEIREEDNKED